MPEYLSPAEVEAWARSEDQSGRPVFAATLREMAAIVEAFTEGDAWETVCNCAARCSATLEHEPSCRYLRARRVMGHE